jgi:hypothetical protein
LLSCVSPQIANVTSFTDGKGTKHIPSMASQLLAKLDRPALAKQYGEQVAKGEWSHAEASMRRLLDSAGRVTTELLALARTGISVDEHGGDPRNVMVLGPVAAAAMEHQGVVDLPVARTEEPASTDDFLSEKLDFETYKPSDFGKLIEELSGKRATQ